MSTTLPWRGALAAGIAATTVAALPTLLVGGLGILIREELGFGEAQLGAAVAASFASAAIVAAPAGRIAERLGPRLTTRIGLACGLGSMVGIALLTTSWAALVLFLALAGIGITTVQLGINVLLARSVPGPRQGVAFGAKQAAVPFASLLAGVAVPAVGLTLGWRAAFLLAAMLVPLVAWRMTDARRPEGRTAVGGGDAPSGPLILLAVGVALASAGGNATPVFVVPSAVANGLAPGPAGLVLAGGSLVGIAVRVMGGWLGDRLGRGSLLLVVTLVAAGAVGYLGLAASDHPVLIALSTALAFGGGWGWGGLILLALSRTNPNAPGRAMGLVQVGPMAGAVLGPLTFGVLAEQVAYAAAWATMAVLAVAGATTIAVSRSWLVRTRAARATAETEAS